MRNKSNNPTNEIHKNINSPNGVEIPNQGGDVGNDVDDVGNDTSGVGNDAVTDDTNVKDEQQNEPDTWRITSDRLIRVHNTPRQEMFALDKETCPIPLDWIDVGRYTYTDLSSECETKIKDFWPTENVKPLSDFWIGRTEFELLRPKAKKGYHWCDGRLTRRQKTDRPPDIWPEIWDAMSKKEKKLAVERWRKEWPRRKAAQQGRHLYIPDTEIE